MRLFQLRTMLTISHSSLFLFFIIIIIIIIIIILKYDIKQ